MKQAILDLISSKRNLIALFTAIADIAILFGFGIPAPVAQHLATLISIIGGVLVAAYSYKETGAKRDSELAMMYGVDPKELIKALEAARELKQVIAEESPAVQDE
jgi:hypothetical protein